MLEKISLPSPKLSLTEKRKSIYPYYAGFSSAFADAIISKFGDSGFSILDPWNGSGTTTEAAHRHGLSATGVEINPALVAISRARLANAAHCNTLYSLIQFLESEKRNKKAFLSEAFADLYIRFIEQNNFRSNIDISLIQTAFFRSIRSLAAESTTKNPTWFSPRRLEELKCTSRAASNQIRLDVLSIISVIQKKDFSVSKYPTIYKGDFKKYRGKQKYDLVLTSPPYLTRIDYVLSTLPELSFLTKVTPGVSIVSLRQNMIGTPIVGRNSVALRADQPDYVRELLAQIESHPSKASGGYYRNFFALYFNGLRASFRRIKNSLSTVGKVVIVVQPSYYKEIMVDLPRACIEMAAAEGLKLHSRENFDQTRSMASVNTRSHLGSLSTLPSETCLIFAR